MIDADLLAWDKCGGLIPAIIQDAAAGDVLMLGYMNREALARTVAERRVTFWSRSKQRLWTKGEGSGHFLEVRSITADCDADTLLILAAPLGPVCHIGTPSCWGEHAPRPSSSRLAFADRLESVIARRIDERPAGSYTAKLFAAGLRRIAQKVGEEGLEVALAAVAEPDTALIGESADLIYHLLLLLAAKGLSFAQVIAELEARHSSRD